MDTLKENVNHSRLYHYTNAKYAYEIMEKDVLLAGGTFPFNRWQVTVFDWDLVHCSDWVWVILREDLNLWPVSEQMLLICQMTASYLIISWVHRTGPNCFLKQIS